MQIELHDCFKAVRALGCAGHFLIICPSCCATACIDNVEGRGFVVYGYHMDVCDGSGVSPPSWSSSQKTVSGVVSNELHCIWVEVI